jgi:transcriptional regulator with XRE-family HTH domain
MNLTEMGKRLRDLRQAKGLSQQKLAEMSNLSLMTINRIELGKASAKLETWTKLASALGTNVVTLIQEN